MESLLEEIQKEQPQKQQFNNVIRYVNVLLLLNYHKRHSKVSVKLSVVLLFIGSYYCCFFRNDDGGIKLSSDELSSDDDDDSLINENRQLFRPGPNGMSDDDLSEGTLSLL